MNQSETVFTKVLLFPGNVNCRYYDKPSYNIEVTLESNLQTAIKSIRQARRDRAAGVPNQEYLKWCKKIWQKRSSFAEKRSVNHASHHRLHQRLR